jgi:drug/metabolite transporter (DMT)-like permease
MAKRAALVALGITLIVVLLPVVFLREPGGNQLTPPVGELVVLGLSVVLVFAVTFAISYVVLRRRGRAATADRRR